MWLLVRSPTLCGSPTLISNVGFAACSMLTLGCVWRFGPSASEGGCTGGGPRNPAPSSSKLPDSTKPVPPNAGGKVVGGGGLRPAMVSFWGGAGASSVGVALVSDGASPSGPRGSTVSSTASRRVACALILRVPRGPRRPGVRTSPPLIDDAAWAGAARSGWLAERPTKARMA
jgi:hypothetical protein